MERELFGNSLLSTDPGTQVLYLNRTAEVGAFLKTHVTSPPAMSHPGVWE